MDRYGTDCRGFQVCISRRGRDLLHTGRFSREEPYAQAVLQILQTGSFLVKDGRKTGAFFSKNTGFRRAKRRAKSKFLNKKFPQMNFHPNIVMIYALLSLKCRESNLRAFLYKNLNFARLFARLTPVFLLKNASVFRPSFTKNEPV